MTAPAVEAKAEELYQFIRHESIGLIPITVKERLIEELAACAVLRDQARALILKWRLEARDDAQQSNQAATASRDRCASELDAILRAE